MGCEISVEFVWVAHLSLRCLEGPFWMRRFWYLHAEAIIRGFKLLVILFLFCLENLGMPLVFGDRANIGGGEISLIIDGDEHCAYIYSLFRDCHSMHRDQVINYYGANIGIKSVFILVSLVSLCKTQTFRNSLRWGLKRMAYFKCNIPRPWACVQSNEQNLSSESVLGNWPVLKCWTTRGWFSSAMTMTMHDARVFAHDFPLNGVKYCPIYQ